MFARRLLDEVAARHGDAEAAERLKHPYEPRELPRGPRRKRRFA